MPDTPHFTYFIRLANDEEGRDVQQQSFISTEALPWPPHQWAAMAVASDPEAAEPNKMVAVVLHPDSTADRAAYNDYLATLRDHLTMSATLVQPGVKELNVMWFYKIQQSKLDPADGDIPNVMRGVLYRPATHEELQTWLDAPTLALAKLGEVGYDD